MFLALIALRLRETLRLVGARAHTVRLMEFLPRQSPAKNRFGFMCGLIEIRDNFTSR